MTGEKAVILPELARRCYEKYDFTVGSRCLPARVRLVIASSSAQSQPQLASATGNGEITAFCGKTRTFSFEAVKDSDGNTTGTAQLVNHCNGVISQSKINCLSGVGNVATMSGTIVSSNVGALIGLDVWFKVADNGQGAGAPPDQMTLALTLDPGTGPTCSQDVGLAFHNIVSGNIQVRP